MPHAMSHSRLDLPTWTDLTVREEEDCRQATLVSARFSLLAGQVLWAEEEIHALAGPVLASPVLASQVLASPVLASLLAWIGDRRDGAVQLHKADHHCGCG